MVVVSCSPRSGGSLVMQSLVILGMESAAKRFIKEHDNIRQFNKGGFYEINDEHGIKDYRHKGKCIKLYGLQLFLTDKKYIDKLIYIERNSSDAIASYEKVRKFLPPCEFTSEQIYNANKFYIEKVIDENTLKLKLEEVKKNPVEFVNKIINFAELTPSPKQISNAVKNIHKCQSHQFPQQ